MLTEKEKEGFREILQNLSESDLIALKDTVTNRRSAAQNKPEAIRAILRYTDDAVELLKRKKIKRDFIFRYLQDRVPVSANAEKSALIRTALNYWGTNRQLLAVVDDVEDAISSPQRSLQPAWQSPWQPARQSAWQPARQSAWQPTRQPAWQSVPQPTLQPPPVVRTLFDKSVPNDIGVATPQPNLAQQLAKQFAPWFFKQLNALNPNVAQGDASEWGPQHFFNDCKLKVSIQAHNFSKKEEFEGADVVSERFRSLVQNEGLVFNPNISDDGTKGVNDPHGLVLVLVSGTLHREGHLGVFEQRFGLVRDPMKNNNWTIKFTEVMLKEC